VPGVFGGLHTTEFDFQVVPQGDGTSGVDRDHHRRRHQLDQLGDAGVGHDGHGEAAGTPDLTFMSTLKGEAVTASARTTVVTLNEFRRVSSRSS